MKQPLIIIIMAVFLVSNLGAQENKVLSADEEKAITEKLRSKAADSDSLVWKNGGTFGLNFTQTYLDNWASGGQSSVSATALFSYFANYKKNKNNWDNTFDFAYGLLRQGDAGQWIKTDDRIDISSKYGREASKNWYYSALLNFRTQFAPGYTIVDGKEVRTIEVGEEKVDARISDFLAPAYTLVALGMDFKPNDKFSAFIAPAVEKATFDELGNKLTDGENIRSEIGGYVKLTYKTDLMENVGLQTRIDLFSNYQNNPGNIDINWETLITMKINKYLTTSITTQLLYDDDIDVLRKAAKLDDEGNILEPASIGPGTQFKEVLAIGFNYKF
jgi:hypothetical protein